MSGLMEQFPVHRLLLDAADSEDTVALVEMVNRQLYQMAEELEEVTDCLKVLSEGVVIDATHMAEEALDLIHAALGLCFLLEKLHPAANIAFIQQQVIAKNRNRGYYRV